MTRITINHWIIAEVLCDLNRSEYADYISQIIIELRSYVYKNYSFIDAEELNMSISEPNDVLPSLS